jgi:hypothetical protein
MRAIFLTYLILLYLNILFIIGTSSQSKLMYFVNTVIIEIHLNNIVKCILIARQRFGKHMPSVNSFNNREAVFYVVRPTILVMQWSGKHA